MTLVARILLLVFMSIFAFFLSSCMDKKERTVESTYDPETTPSVKTNMDTMYISDSGMVKFKVIAETMMYFDKAKEPYMLFPDKAYLEQYDSLMTIITTLRADSVWNFEKKKLWKLRGNVNIVNIEGKTFDSEELFWDEVNDKIYSDLYVEINEPNKTTIRAYGFESNQHMTVYTFRRATDVDLYISEDEESEANEETITEKEI